MTEVVAIDEDFVQLEENSDTVDYIGKVNDGVADEMPPLPFEEGWTAHVMSFFRPDELANGNPKTAALRRVAQQVFGTIIESSADLVSSPSKDNGLRVIVKSTIVFQMLDGQTRVFSDLSDAHRYNTESQFSQHLTGVAATRAEGRTLRKALGLTNILAAEELAPPTEQIEKEVEWEPESINDQQITTIDVVCQRLDIDVVAFVNSGRKFYADHTQIPRGLAALMLKKLSSYQNSPESIPEGLKGYNPEWSK